MFAYLKVQRPSSIQLVGDAWAVLACAVHQPELCCPLATAWKAFQQVLQQSQVPYAWSAGP